MGGVSRHMNSEMPNSQMQEVKPSLGLGIIVSGLLRALRGREGRSAKSQHGHVFPPNSTGEPPDFREILQLEDLN